MSTPDSNFDALVAWARLRSPARDRHIAVRVVLTILTAIALGLLATFAFMLIMVVAVLVILWAL